MKEYRPGVLPHFYGSAVVVSAKHHVSDRNGIDVRVALNIGPVSYSATVAQEIHPIPSHGFRLGSFKYAP
jgi:hypothetical protein